MKPMNNSSEKANAMGDKILDYSTNIISDKLKKMKN